jgi:ABC-2 type transport system permease protein
MSVQGVLAFLMTAFAGPGLISPDLANGALPLYFCRPFSRAEYVLGKSAVLGILLSEITWVPGVILFIIQASFAGASWTWNNLWIVGSFILGSLIWIAILSMLAMALSAWVKWRIVAGALLLAVMFFGAGFAQAVNAVLRIDAGHFFDIGYLMAVVWTSLFQRENELAISPGQAWIAILLYCSVCLWLLMRKVRAYEVVR